MVNSNFTHIDTSSQEDFLIPISLQPNVVNLRYLKLLILLDKIKYQMFTKSGCKDIGIKDTVCGTDSFLTF